MALIALTALTFISFSYAVVALIDERIAARREQDAAVEWARLTRAVWQARRQFGDGQ